MEFVYTINAMRVNKPPKIEDVSESVTNFLKKSRDLKGIKNNKINS